MYYGRFSVLQSHLSDFHLLHCGCEMADDDLDSNVFTVLPELMPVDCSGPAAVRITEPESQPVYMSSCDSRLSRSDTLLPPLVSLRPLYTSCTPQQQQQNISDELPGDMFRL